MGNLYMFLKELLTKLGRNGARVQDKPTILLKEFAIHAVSRLLQLILPVSF
jgi:hypothetical protein